MSNVIDRSLPAAKHLLDIHPVEACRRQSGTYGVLTSRLVVISVCMAYPRPYWLLTSDATALRGMEP